MSDNLLRVAELLSQGSRVTNSYYFALQVTPLTIFRQLTYLQSVCQTCHLVSLRHLPRATVSPSFLLSQSVCFQVPCLVHVQMQQFMPESKPSDDNFLCNFACKEGWDMVGSRHKHSGQSVGVNKLPFRMHWFPVCFGSLFLSKIWPLHFSMGFRINLILYPPVSLVTLRRKKF